MHISLCQSEILSLHCPPNIHHLKALVGVILSEMKVSVIKELSGHPILCVHLYHSKFVCKREWLGARIPVQDDKCFLLMVLNKCVCQIMKFRRKSDICICPENIRKNKGIL